jgi:hypothetical protein
MNLAISKCPFGSEYVRLIGKHLNGFRFHSYSGPGWLIKELDWDPKTQWYEICISYIDYLLLKSQWYAHIIRKYTQKYIENRIFVLFVFYFFPIHVWIKSFAILFNFGTFFTIRVIILGKQSKCMIWILHISFLPRSTSNRME